MAAKRRQKKKPADRTLGVTVLAGAAAAVGLGAALGAALFRRARGAPAAGHAAPDLAGDRPRPGAARAPEHFRPDPTAVPTADEREALRPATGSAPSLAADRGTTIG